MTPILPDRLCWFSAIGNFIVNFSTLDLLTQDFLEAALSLEDFLRIKERRFRDRIERIEKHVREGNYSLEKVQQFEQFFRRLAPMRELRNHIAHGVLRFELDQNLKPKALTLSLPRDLDGSSSPEARHLEYRELENALSELTCLIEEFTILPGAGAAQCDARFGNREQN